MAYDRQLEDDLLEEFAKLAGGKSYAEGGVVEDDGGYTPEQLQQYSQHDPETTGGINLPTPSPDQLQGLIGDDSADDGGFTPDQMKQMLMKQGLLGEEGPEPEGKLMTAGREAVAYAPAAIGAVPAMGAGAALGAMAGAPFAGIGAIPGATIGGAIGALAGGLGAGWAISSATDWVRDELGINDREQRAANAEANPVSSFVGQAIPQAASFGFGAVPIGARAVNALLGGGLEAIQNEVHEGEISPWRVAGSAVLGGAMAKPTGIGEKLLGMGQKKGQTVGDFLKDKYQATRAPQTNNGTANVAAAPPTQATPNPQNTPAVSPRQYPSEDTTGQPAATPMLPNGVAPDTLAALDSAFGTSNSKGTGFTPEDIANAPSGQIVDTGIERAGREAKQKLDLSQLEAERPVNVDTGFPEPHGTVDFDGIKVSVENVAGEKRRGTGADGKPWEVEMPVPYGEIEGTRGADGDKVDAFLGPHKESTTALVIEQKNLKTGEFDEHKVMLGFDSGADAVKAFTDSFSDGKGAARVMAVHEMPMDDLKGWLHSNTRERITPKTPEVVGALPEKGVAPANMGADGKMYVGKSDTAHFMLSEEHGPGIRERMGLKPGEETWKSVGFTTPEGKFLNREQALEWVSKNEKKIRPSENMGKELDALDYRDQVPAGKRKGLDLSGYEEEAPRGEADFGDAAIAAAQAKPIVAYHGTRTEFDKFDPRYLGRNVSAEADQGFFFSTDPKTASGYAEGTAPGGHVKRVAIKMSDPQTIPFSEHRIRNVVKSDEQIRKILDDAMEAGHDGVVFKAIDGRGGHDLVVPFDHENIQSIPYGEPKTGEAKITPPKKGNKRPTLDLGLGDEPVTATVKPEVTKAIDLAKANGYDRLAAAIEAAPAEQKAVLADRTRRKLGEIRQAPKVEGLEVTARDKTDAARKSKAVNAVQEAFDKFTPDVDTIPTDKKGITALRKRLTDAIAHAETGKDDAGKLYKPKQTTAAYEWLAAARKLINSGQAPSKIKEFLATEKQLRSGKPEDVENVRAEKRATADRELRRGPTVDQATDARAKEHVFELPADDEAALGVAEPVTTAADLRPNEVTKDAETRIEATFDKKAPDGRRVLEDLTTPDWKAQEAERLTQQQERTAELKRLRAEAPKEEAAENPGRKVELTDEAKLAALASLDKAKAKAEARAAPKPTAAEAPSAIKKVLDVVDKFKADEAGSGVLLKPDPLAAAKAREPGYIAKDANSPQEVTARELDNKFQVLDQADVTHALHQQKAMKAMPEPFKTDAVQEKLYYAREAGELNKLTPEELAAYDKNLKEIFEQNDLLYDNIEAIAPKILGPRVGNHTMRIRRGYTPETDTLQGGKGKDPVSGPTGLSTGKKGPMFDRVFMALERADGQRVVVSENSKKGEEGLTAWSKYRAIPLKVGETELKAGNVVEINGQKFLVREAMTPEIEANARFEDGKPARYYHNALVSAMLANHYLANTARHLQYMHELKSDPEFLAHATRNAEKAAKNGWETTDLPQFKRPGDTWYMDKRIKYVMDDYAQPGFQTGGVLDYARRLSRAVTKLIFLIPTAHAMNVGAHWFVERGWDWINPVAYRRLVATGAKAIKSVYTQDHFQDGLRREGAGTVYGGVLTQDTMKLIFDAAGARLVRDPSKWDAIAKIVGHDPRDLEKAIYRQSSKMMWAASDMFLTQAIMENQMKGMSKKLAIDTAEQHIPNYRVPTTIISQGPGGRFLSKLMQDQAITAFGRYHYGVFNSFAHMAKDMTSGEGPRTLDALGKLFALGLLMYVVKPALDKVAQTVTGDEHAESAPRGPLAPLSHIAKSVRGEEDIASVMRGAVTTAPLLATVKEGLLDNRDFAGRQIVEPATVRSAFQGNPKAMGRVAVQEADHAARGLVAPYGLVMQGAQKGQNPLETARDAVLDIKTPSNAANLYKARLQKILAQREISRFKKPPSFAESLYNKITGFR